MRIGVSFPNEKVAKVVVMPPHIDKDFTEEYIARLFVESGLPKLVVFDTKIKGVISLTNILNYFMKAGKLTVANLKNTLVKDVMKKEVYHVYNTDLIGKAIRTFSAKNVSSLVVFSKKTLFGKGHLFGIITKTDILTRYLATFKKTKININIASKVKNLDEKMVNKKLKGLERILSKGTNVFVYFKQGKEKFRGLPLINCRLRIVMSGISENVSVEGWGVEHSLELAITKIKRKLTEVDFS